MKYRTLGRTGLTVSEIGMGCEGFVDKSDAEVRTFVDAMEAAGVNCIDLYSPNPQVRSALGRAIAGRREKFVLQAHLSTTWKDGQYKRTRDIAEVKEGFADLTQRLGTEYIDIGMIHYIDAMDDWNDVKDGPVMAYARELLAAGKIGCIGISSHNPQVAQAAVDSGLVDVLMFSINPLYDLLPADEDVDKFFDKASYAAPLKNIDPDRAALYESCQREGVGITVMKAFGGGDLLNAEMSPAGVALTAHQCIHYCLTRPGVASVLCGAHTVEEMMDSVAYEDADEAARDYAPALAAMNGMSWRGHCMYCGHCAPCPVGISVADVTKFLNLTKAQGFVPETVREHYAALAHHAGECVGCGACETRCPFGVDVRKNMREAAEVFGR